MVAGLEDGHIIYTRAVPARYLQQGRHSFAKSGRADSKQSETLVYGGGVSARPTAHAQFA